MPETCAECQGRGWLALEDELLKLGYLGEIMPCSTCQPEFSEKWLFWRREVPALLPESLVMEGEYPPGQWDLDDVAEALEEAVEAKFQGKRLTGTMLAEFLARRLQQGFQIERHNQRLATMPQTHKDIKEVKPAKHQASPKRPPTILDAFRE